MPNIPPIRERLKQRLHVRVLVVGGIVGAFDFAREILSHVVYYALYHH